MKKILVIGDVMLDEYIETSPVRLSDEAPVMIVKEQNRDYVLGGAGNTAANLKAMGFDVVLQGTADNDWPGECIRDILRVKKIGVSLVIQQNVKTTVKTRILCKGNQVLRVDVEGVSSPLTPLNILDVSCVVVSDYAKGVIGENIIRDIQNNTKAPIIVNGKPKNAEYYIGADVLVVNQKEADEILNKIRVGGGVESEDSYEVIAGFLNILYVVVTKGEKGIAVYDSKGLRSEVYGDIVDVKDITGAGDTVTAAIALELTLSGDIEKAIKLANKAGGIKVTKDKTAEVSLVELNVNPENEGGLSTEQIIANLESDRLDG